jgi:hypothetical protein
MRPFQEFRFWARRAPLSERVTAAVAALVAVALIAWLLVPDRDDSAGEDVFASGSDVAAGAGSGSSDTTASGIVGGDGAVVTTPSGVAAPGVGGRAGTGSSGGSGGSGDTSAASSSGSGAPAASAAGADQGCVSPPGKAKGVTDTEVKVAIALTEIVGPAANSLFDVPTPAQARADFEAAIAGINKEGGVACRKLVARYINVNPVNESQMMGVCRDVADSDVFAMVDTGSLATRPAVLACFGQRKVPYFGAFYITNTARQQFYPYIFSFYYKEQVYKDTAFALRDLGFFDPAKGFKKLGFIYRDCEREAINAFRGWIREAGVPDNKVVTYNVGCPAVFASEADLGQAVLTFQREGVTHVVPGNFQGDIARFTAHAEQQGFRPKYGFPDEALLSIASGSRAPNPDNIANAIGITLGRDGEQNTAGLAPTAGTQKCNAYRKAAGLPPVYDVPANAGHACDQLWMLQAALSRAPEISATALQVGLQRAESIDFSFPQGPNDFTGNGVTTGGQFWRAAQFMPDCDCWRVIQADFRRGY